MKNNFLFILFLILFFDCQANPRQKRVINGQIFNSANMPWVVYVKSVFFDQRRFMMCGGSLITERVVLTAAHCVYAGKPAGQVFIYAKGPSTKQIQSNDVIKAAEVVIHPMFIQNTSTLSYDMAIVVLERPLQVHCGAILSNSQQLSLGGNNFVTPPRSTMTVTKTADLNCYTVGWGLTELALPSLQLRKVFLHPFVRATYNGERFFTIPLNMTERPCLGDSGGPLVCSSPMNPVPIIFGINSAVVQVEYQGFTRNRREANEISECVNANAMFVSPIQENSDFIYQTLFRRNLHYGLNRFNRCHDKNW